MDACVHPKTLGSTLVSAGKLDKTKYPHAQVIVKGNLVGVVAPTEWEAIQAAQQVAGDTKWTDWKGLPGSAKLYEHLRNEADWKSTPVMKSGATKGDAGPALASAHKKLSATYQLSYMKHAPIGPTMAIGDVKADGMVHVHTHNQNPQQLRGEIAKMLGMTIDHVIVHIYPGPGTTEDQTAETQERKMRRSSCHKPSASRCACSGCVRTTCSGPRNRRPHSPMLNWQSTIRASSLHTRSTTSCRPCRTIGRLARCLPGCRRCRRRTSTATLSPQQ